MTVYGLKSPNDGLVYYIGATTRDPAVRLREHMTRKAPGKKMREWLATILPELVVLEETDDADAQERWIQHGLDEGWPKLNVKRATHGFDNPDHVRLAVENSRKTRKGAAYSKLRRELGKEKWQDPAYRQHMVEAHLGQKPTGKGARGRLGDPNEPNPMHNPETVEKMRRSNTGRKLSADHRAKMSQAQRTRRQHERETGTGCASAEFSRKVSAITKGRKPSDEARRKMSAAQKRHIARGVAR